VESVPSKEGADTVIIAKVHRVSAFLIMLLSISKKKLLENPEIAEKW
jgi:hypothetical protein